jgi:hypothetical protein
MLLLTVHVNRRGVGAFDAGGFPSAAFKRSCGVFLPNGKTMT